MTTYTSRETYEFISRQTNDPIVEWKTCKISGQPFPITQKDLQFYDSVSPMFNGVKYHIPTPTLCPEERQRRRLAFRQERKLYKRKSDLSGKEMISLYTPNKLYKVYEQTERWSDRRNPLDYGKEYDFSKTFFQQFDELYHQVPLVSLRNVNPENGAYNNNSSAMKDSYMNFNSDEGKEVFYSYVSEFCTNVIDCSYIYHSEHCFNCCDIKNGFNCFFSHDLENCSDCYFCSDLVSCKFCYGSHGLRNANYVRFGEHKTKEEWLALFAQYHKVQNFNEASQHSSELALPIPKKHLTLTNTENCAGDYLTNSKNLTSCFDMVESEDCKYVTYSAFGPVKNVYDTYAIGGMENTYECNEGGININGCCFIKHMVNGLFKSFYCILCGNNSSNLFGCIGLRGKEYYILNKQYTKEKYEELVPKIIEKMKADEEWGEYFPASISPFGYNETLANEYFPLTEETSGLQGYKRSDYSSDPKIPENATLLYPAQLPDEKRNALVNDDSVLKKVIICKESQRPFIIQKLELDFYRKMGLPLPKFHPDVRHEKRMKQRPGRTLHLRHCDNCRKEMVSVYPADDERKVYCETCYQKEIYG